MAKTQEVPEEEALGQGSEGRESQKAGALSRKEHCRQRQGPQVGIPWLDLSGRKMRDCQQCG